MPDLLDGAANSPTDFSRTSAASRHTRVGHIPDSGRLDFDLDPKKWTAPYDNLALINRSQICQGITRLSFDVRPVSGCSPARRSRTSRPSSASRGHALQVAAPGADRRRSAAGAQELRGRSAAAGSSAHQRARGRAQSGQGGQRPLRGGSRRPKRKFQVVRGLNNLGYSERVCLSGSSASIAPPITTSSSKSPTTARSVNCLLADAIADIHARSRGTYGMLRVRAALEIEQGLIVNTKLVKKIMRQLGIQGLPGPQEGLQEPEERADVRGPRAARLPRHRPRTSCG